MKRLCVALLLAAAAGSCAPKQSAPGGAGATTAPAGPAQGTFRPDDVKWQPGPAGLPAGAQFAILEGDPAKPAYFAMRVRMPDGYKIPPHWHPAVERVTVLSGTLRLGMGETFEPAAFVYLPAGSYAYMAAGMRHYAAAEGETVIQLATLGPWGITYVNKADDPREKR